MPLLGDEIEEMLNWLPYLDMLFPEAVDFATEMPQVALERNSIVHDISEGNLWSKHPEATAKLLIHLADSESPSWAWHGGKELIDKLIMLDLPLDIREKLEEIPSRLGLSAEGA